MAWVVVCGGCVIWCVWVWCIGCVELCVGGGDSIVMVPRIFTLCFIIIVIFLLIPFFAGWFAMY